jgi:hypothetical protein
MVPKIKHRPTRMQLVMCILVGLLGALSAWSRATWQTQTSETPQTASPKSPHHQHSMPGMTMDHGTSTDKGHEGHGQNVADKSSDAEPSAPGNRTEAEATRSMHSGHHMDGDHMRMTSPRAATAEDISRADKIVAALRDSIEIYKDYRLALADGYRIFLPRLPQREYHFNNYWNGYLEGFTFEPTRPTSLLYKKTKTGYELIGAMYTAPQGATLEQLNERIPVGVAQWHAHTNLCMPSGARNVKIDWTRFGLTGSISTPESCKRAGGRFYPQVFGWMVHVYPFETTRAKIWAQ